MRAAKRQLGAVAAEERGALLEGWVLTVLRAHNEQTALLDDILVLAPAQARQTEVDFLLRRGRDYLAALHAVGARGSEGHQRPCLVWRAA